MGAQAATPVVHPVVAARLTASASVPKGPKGATGTARITLNTKNHKACWKISVRGIDKPLSAHVRKAPPGKIGPVVIPLGARFTKTGCVLLPKKSVVAVGSKPTAYYVDVLTRKYLNGALRGQLRVSK
jgi:hypothetical protein